MSIDEIIENFELLEEWDDRYRYLIELGRTLPPLPEAARNDANKVQGCASQVWLSTTVKPNGATGPVLTFDGDSDAHIVRGLIAVLFALYSGKGAKRHSLHRRRRAVREARAARAPHAAALERLPLHGRAHPPRRQRGAGGGRLISVPSPTPTTNSASSASQVRTAALPRPRASPLQTVVPRQPIEAELQHHLGRARRPAALALDVVQALEEAADVDQQAGEFRPDRVERVPHALARADHRLGEGRGRRAARGRRRPRRSSSR